MNCAFPNCNINALPGKQYCIGHNKMFGTTTMAKPESVKKISDKMKLTKQELRKRVAAFLARPENKYCKIKFPGCTKIATVVNHTNGRHGNILNEDDFEASCENCNGRIESDHSEAAAEGHKKQRHNKENLRGKVKQIAEAKPFKPVA